MKILKSGIEMDPSELRKAKGGSCACGCGIGFDGEVLSISGYSGSSCECGCTTPPPYNAFGGNLNGAHRQIIPPIGF